MKCTQCGSENFVAKDILTREGDKVFNADAYVCTKCGHIEWFADEKELKKTKDKASGKEEKPWKW